MDTEKFELSEDELSCEELDAVSGGDCTLSDVAYAINSGNPLAMTWLKMGCPVPKSK